MIERGDGPGLGEEAIQRGPIFGDRAGHDLQGHAAIHRHVLGEEDGAHAAFAQPLNELVLAQAELRPLAQGQERAGLPAADEIFAGQGPGQGGRIGRFTGKTLSLDKLLRAEQFALFQRRQVFVHGANGHNFPYAPFRWGYNGSLAVDSPIFNLPENCFFYQQYDSRFENPIVGKRKFPANGGFPLQPVAGVAVSLPPSFPPSREDTRSLPPTRAFRRRTVGHCDRSGPRVSTLHSPPIPPAAAVRGAPKRAVQQFLAFHVVGDEPGSPRRDMLRQGLQAGGHVILAIDRLAHVVQEGRQEELLVVRQFIPGQIEDLKTVIQGVAFGMILAGFP